jgi:hypothetical protein
MKKTMTVALGEGGVKFTGELPCAQSDKKKRIVVVLVEGAGRMVWENA